MHILGLEYLSIEGGIVTNDTALRLKLEGNIDTNITKVNLNLSNLELRDTSIEGG